MLAQFYAPIVGGEERMTQSLATALVARGHDVAVATLAHPGLAPVERLDGVRIHRLPGLAARVGGLFSESGRRHAPPAPDPETVIALRRLLRRDRPDVIHGHNWLAHAYLPLRRGDRAAYVLSLHDYSLVCATKRLMLRGTPCSGPGPLKCPRCAYGTYGVVGPAVALLTAASGRAQQRAADLLLPVSEAVARGCGLVARAVPHEVVPNFRSESVAPDDGMLPRELPEGPFVLFVGDISIDKGVGILVEAHARLSPQVPLVLAGREVDAGLVPEREGIVNLGLQPYPAVLAAMRRATVAVVPSIWPDPFPTVTLEAMAAGAAVVVSGIGGLSEQVVDGESGVVVAPGDVGELARALSRTLADAPLRERLGAGGRARAALFSTTAVVPRYERAYERALAIRAARFRDR